MTDYLNKKQTNLLVIAAWTVYAAATLARLTYSASMVRIISSLGITNAEAGTVLSAFAATYGAGQLVNGLLCRFYNIRLMVTLAMTVSSLVTFALPFSPSSTVMAILWAVNGAAQSVLWSLIIRTLSVYVARERIGHAIVVISTTTAVGTTAAYALSAVFVALGAWQITFIVAAILCLASAILWVSVIGSLGKPSGDKSAESAENRNKKASFSGYFITLFVFICVSAFCNGFVRDGVNSWMPKLLTDQFGVGDSMSIILTLILPLFSVLGAIIARKTYYRMRNLGTLLCVFFGVTAFICAGVYFIYPARLLIPTVILFTFVSCGMAAVNNVTVGIFPIDNRSYMDAGASAGILDTMCYVGSSAAGSIIGATAESTGWERVFVILIVCAIVCAGVSALFAVFEHRKSKQISP